LLADVALFPIAFDDEMVEPNDNFNEDCGGVVEVEEILSEDVVKFKSELLLSLFVSSLTTQSLHSHRRKIYYMIFLSSALFFSHTINI
jgi:hypothetical protein